MNAVVTVDVQVASESRDIPDDAAVRVWIAAAIAAAGDSTLASSIEVSVRVVDEPEGRQLNHEYRGRERATNVLSFPAGDELPDGVPRLLGDIVICAPVVTREAGDQGKRVADHWAHLLVHGTLHLLGYEHENEPDAARMEALETRILAAHDVAEPYAD